MEIIIAILMYLGVINNANNFNNLNNQYNTQLNQAQHHTEVIVPDPKEL